MTTNYDEGHTPERYQQAKAHPWRARVEEFSLMKLVGDVRGKNVVDVACGEGYFTRKLRQANAAKVVGMDVSERMIELARRQEQDDPLGIDYRVQDARSIAVQHHFDLAVAAWLLVYAHDRQELAQMCQGLARLLRPGGRFVTITTNPDVYSFKPTPDYRKYGFEMKLAAAAVEGAPILWRNHVEGAVLDIENYYLPLSAYEQAFTNAGFRSFAVHPLELFPAEQKEDVSYWDELLEYPIAILIDCIIGANSLQTAGQGVESTTEPPSQADPVA